jgi:hypothetical protein
LSNKNESLENSKAFIFPNNLRYLFEKKLRKANKAFIRKENEFFDELICDDELLKEMEKLNEKAAKHDHNSFYKIEWIHNGKIKKNGVKNSNYKIEKNKLTFNKTMAKDTGVYVCTANFSFLKHVILVDFASIIITKDEPNYKKFLGEKLSIPCNGLVIKSLFQTSNISMTWLKNNLAIKNVPFDYSTWREYELGWVGNYSLKKLNLNDSGEYKCLVIDHDTNRSWTTNSIKIHVIDRQTDSLKHHKPFWISLLIFSIAFIIFNLIVLKKSYEKKAKTELNFKFFGRFYYRIVHLFLTEKSKNLNRDSKLE